MNYIRLSVSSILVFIAGGFASILFISVKHSVNPYSAQTRSVVQVGPVRLFEHYEHVGPTYRSKAFEALSDRERESWLLIGENRILGRSLGKTYEGGAHYNSLVSIAEYTSRPCDEAFENAHETYVDLLRDGEQPTQAERTIIKAIEAKAKN
jgi:hypothetical protein